MSARKSKFDAVNKLRFPSGRTVAQLKKDAKQRLPTQVTLLQSNEKSHTDVLNALCREHGIDLPWDKAIEHLKHHWSQWFSFGTYVSCQADHIFLVDVRQQGFQTEAEAIEHAESFDGSLLWVGGDAPLALLERNASQLKTLHNYDVRLWRARPEIVNKWSISDSDIERIYTAIPNWPELFGTALLTFSTLSCSSEFGDGNGIPIPIDMPDPNKKNNGIGELDPIGLSQMSEQPLLRVVQLRHRYDPDSTAYYLFTTQSTKEILDIIAALFHMMEDENYLPHYLSGGITFGGRFISDVFQGVFGQRVRSSKDTLTDQESNCYLNSDVDMIDIYSMMDAFDHQDYDIERYRAVFLQHREQVLGYYRSSIGIPVSFDEHQWKLINVNPHAIARQGIPLELNGLTVHKAWSLHHQLETAILKAISLEMDVDLDEQFSTVHQWYRDKSNSDMTYPRYRVSHHEFDFRY